MGSDPVDSAITLYEPNRIPGQIVVDDGAAVLKVLAFGQYVGADQDIDLTLGEAPLPLPIRGELSKDLGPFGGMITAIDAADRWISRRFEPLLVRSVRKISTAGVDGSVSPVPIFFATNPPQTAALRRMIATATKSTFQSVDPEAQVSLRCSCAVVARYVILENMRYFRILCSAFVIPWFIFYLCAAENGGGPARPSGREEVSHVQSDGEKGDGKQETDLGEAATRECRELRVAPQVLHPLRVA